MNRKDIAAFRRRLAPEKHDISVIRGCYLNEKGEIVSTFSKSPLSLPESEMAHYLSTFKKTLGGAPGRNRFTLPVQADDPGARLLKQLQTSGLTDEKAVDGLCQVIRERVELEGSCLILMMHDACAVPRRRSEAHGDRPELEDAVFNYIMVSVCPVKLTKPQLTFFSDDRDFHTVEPDLAVAAPALGFMYPLFEDGGADVNAALYFTKDAENLHADFIDAVFGAAAPASAADTREAFYGVLGDTLDGGIPFDVVQTLHENLTAQLADRKNDAAPLQVSRREIASLLASCQVPANRQAAFENEYLERFGAVGMEAATVVDQKGFRIVSGEDVKIEVSPDRSDLVEMKRIDGKRVIMITVEGDVSVNGVDVVIP